MSSKSTSRREPQLSAVEEIYKAAGLGTPERIRALYLQSCATLIDFTPGEARALLRHVRVLGDLGKLSVGNERKLIRILKLEEFAGGHI